MFFNSLQPQQNISVAHDLPMGQKTVSADGHSQTQSQRSEKETRLGRSPQGRRSSSHLHGGVWLVSLHCKPAANNASLFSLVKELGSYQTHRPTVHHGSKMKSWRTTVGVHLRFKPGWFSPGHPTKHSLGNESTSQLIPTRLLAALPKAFSGALSWLQRGNKCLFGHEGPPRKA